MPITYTSRRAVPEEELKPELPKAKPHKEKPTKPTRFTKTSHTGVNKKNAKRK